MGLCGQPAVEAASGCHGGARSGCARAGDGRFPAVRPVDLQSLRTTFPGPARRMGSESALAGYRLDLSSAAALHGVRRIFGGLRSEEHTSELPPLMRISYAVFCLKKKKHIASHHIQTHYMFYPTTK